MNKLHTLKDEIGKILIGKEDITELLLIALINNSHVLLESVPGTGKTLLAKSFAKATGGSFKRIQFTPDVLPGDVSGIHMYNPKTREFDLKKGPVFTNILLADEINRATPRTQSSLLEAMEEKQVTIDGTTLVLPQPFMVIATQNPIESQQGTFPLPEAQLDRFFLKIDSGYPSFQEEKQMIKAHRNENPYVKLGEVLTAEEIVTMQKAVRHIMMSPEVEDYLLNIIHRTRNHQDIEVGASPRATLALMNAARGRAYLRGREYIIPEDIKMLASFVLSHRMVLTMEGGMRQTGNGVISGILSEVEPPVENGAIK